MSLSHDTVTNVASRLQIQLSTRILEKTRSALRGLQFQTPYGSLGKGDNDLKRASALLEYVAREEEGVSIPLKQLATAAYAKEADFVKFHRQVGHFRQTPTISGSHQNLHTNDVVTTRSRKSSLGSAPVNKNVLLSTIINTPTSIPSLAMKLGSHVNDSHGVAMRAQRLWNQLIRSHQHNPDQLRDMARFAKVYEAVCFFIQATQDARIDEDDEGKRLQPKTLLQVCTHFTLADFNDILVHVQSLLESTETDKAASSSKASAATGSRTSSGPSDKKSSGKIQGSTTSMKKRKLASTDISSEGKNNSRSKTTMGKSTNTNSGGVDAVLECANTIEILDDDPFGYTLTEPSDTSFSPRFLHWKQKIVDQAIESATLVWERDHPGETSTHTKLLEIAAQTVLESYGLLPIKN